ncbi:unnamed protein product [Linum trigynum]|uniref:Uncharacterized protein n=1 Tax=Linum trigynum TaxID=586398 RepID=A0AAV2F3D1_9ROSI
MSKGPGLYSDFGKKAKDLLTRDYLSDQKISISSFTDSGVAVTSNVVEKGGLSSGDVAAEYKHKNATVGFKVDTESNVITTVSVTNYPSSTKSIASVKLPDFNSGKLEVQHFHHHAGAVSDFRSNKYLCFYFS